MNLRIATAILVLNSIPQSPSLEPTQLTADASAAQLVGAYGASDDGTPLQVCYFTPKHADQNMLANAARQLFGDKVAARVPTPGVNVLNWPISNVPHVMQFANSILLRDTSQRCAEMLRTLDELDQRAQVQLTEDSQPAASELYLPKHASLASLSQALSTLGIELTTLEEQRALLLHGTNSEVARALRMLEQLDVAAPQVTLSCYIVRGSRSADVDKLLAPELVTNLRRLLPLEGFELVTVGMLKCSMNSPTLQMQLNGAQGDTYTLELTPSSYDAASGELSFSSCHVVLRGVDGGDQEFGSALSARAGEFTVLGAVGANPVFVVLSPSIDKRPH